MRLCSGGPRPEHLGATSLKKNEKGNLVKKLVASVGVVGLAASGLVFTATSASAASSNPTNCYKEYGYFHVLHDDSIMGNSNDGGTADIEVPMGKWKIKAKGVSKKSNCAYASHKITEWLYEGEVNKKWTIGDTNKGFAVSKGDNKWIKMIYVGT